MRGASPAGIIPASNSSRRISRANIWPAGMFDGAKREMAEPTKTTDDGSFSPSRKSTRADLSSSCLILTDSCRLCSLFIARFRMCGT